jgi:hypothetical protein
MALTVPIPGTATPKQTQPRASSRRPAGTPVHMSQSIGRSHILAGGRRMCFSRPAAVYADAPMRLPHEPQPCAGRTNPASDLLRRRPERSTPRSSEPTRPYVSFQTNPAGRRTNEPLPLHASDGRCARCSLGSTRTNPTVCLLPKDSASRGRARPNEPDLMCRSKRTQPCAIRTSPRRCRPGAGGARHAASGSTRTNPTVCLLPNELSEPGMPVQTNPRASFKTNAAMADAGLDGAGTSERIRQPAFFERTRRTRGFLPGSGGSSLWKHSSLVRGAPPRSSLTVR